MDPERTVTFDPAEHPPMERQFMLSQLVVPRPIAMVSTRSPDGVANIAPMSYYLPITGDPMLLGITMGLRETGQLKDTYNNAMASGDFVVNVTTEVFRDRIETVAMEAPAEVDEYELAGWTPVPATKVASPAIRRGAGPPRVRGAQGGRPRNAGENLQRGPPGDRRGGVGGL